MAAVVLEDRPKSIGGMRIAGRLGLAKCWTSSRPHVKPGVTTGELNDLCHDYMVERAGHRAGAAELRAARLHAVPEVDLHLGQPPGLPRHPGRPGAEERRHRQHRRHRDQGRLPRRHQPHVHRRRAARSGQAPGARSPTNACGSGIAQGPPGRAPGRHRPRDPGARREATASRWCASSAATASAASSTRSRRCCTTARPGTLD